MKKGDRTPVVLLEEIFPGDTNAYGTAFGGKILALMDRAAGLAAARFGHANFVTASFDAIDFRAPVHEGDIAEIEAQVVYTSTHTCGIRVNVCAVDKAAWRRRPCCSGVVFMVATGPDGRPVPVPLYTPSTPEEQKEWDETRAIHRSFIERRRQPPNECRG